MSEPGLHKAPVHSCGDFQNTVPRLGFSWFVGHQEGTSEENNQCVWLCFIYLAPVLINGSFLCRFSGSLREWVCGRGNWWRRMPSQDQTRPGERHLQLLHADTEQGDCGPIDHKRNTLYIWHCSATHSMHNADLILCANQFVFCCSRTGSLMPGPKVTRLASWTTAASQTVRHKSGLLMGTPESDYLLYKTSH